MAWAGPQPRIFIWEVRLTFSISFSRECQAVTVRCFTLAAVRSMLESVPLTPVIILVSLLRDEQGFVGGDYWSGLERRHTKKC